MEEIGVDICLNRSVLCRSGDLGNGEDRSAAEQRKHSDPSGTIFILCSRKAHNIDRTGQYLVGGNSDREQAHRYAKYT